MGNWQPESKNNGFIKYYKYENVEDEVRNLMDKWLTKNL